MQFNGLLFFVIVICVGYLSVKSRLVPESATDVLPPLLLNVCFPAMLFMNFAQTEIQELIGVGVPTVIATLVFSLLPFLVSIPLFRRADAARRPLLRYLSGVGNTSFVCIPLMSLFLTKSEMSIVFIHGAVMDFLIWGVHHQVFLGTTEGSRRQIVKKVLLTPNLIAVAAGVLCSVFSVRLPAFLTYTLDGIAAAVSPIALLFIGMLICRYGLFGWVKSKTAILYSLWKVLALPCVVFAVLYFLLPFKTACILAILLGSPAPVTAVLWAKQYGKDTKLAVDCLIPSTLLYFAVMGTILAILLKSGVIGV
ncbi:MAG: AEC family transporter [Oscillospiraceae bacterium]|nr:AEC family transporter [Oscillospiraceae bacterium]